jgi:hypothetical protein
MLRSAFSIAAAVVIDFVDRTNVSLGIVHACSHKTSVKLKSTVLGWFIKSIRYKVKEKEMKKVSLLPLFYPLVVFLNPAYFAPMAKTVS